MAELKRCPECGGVATVIHMYDTYDRADFGWDAGCGRYRASDGLHTKKMKVSGLPSKEKAIEAWNRRVQGWLSGYDFSVLMQELLVSPNAYVIPIGNWENVNAAVAQILVQRIRRHPLLWKLFFMI